MTKITGAREPKALFGEMFTCKFLYFVKTGTYRLCKKDKKASQIGYFSGNAIVFAPNGCRSYLYRSADEDALRSGKS
jgi:hypothetical protein